MLLSVVATLDDPVPMAYTLRADSIMSMGLTLFSAYPSVGSIPATALSACLIAASHEASRKDVLLVLVREKHTFGSSHTR